jgi:acyl carrier protein
VPRNGKATDGPAAEKIIAELSRRSAENLPLHMRTSAYFLVPEIPLTAHGKVDRAALREWSARQQGPCARSFAMSSTEKVVAEIWEGILKKSNIGTRDDFFDLGGTSLALIRIFSRVNAHFNLSLNGSILAEEATVSRLAFCVDEQLAGNRSRPSPQTPTEQTVIQIWEDILHRKNIGAKDDFFDLGGTSLALIRIFSRVNAHFNLSLNGSILAQEATVSCLANCVDAELQHDQAQIARRT